MRNDTTAQSSDEAWEAYFDKLNASGCFLGGSAIGGGVCVRKDGQMPAISDYLDGFIRVRAANIEEAKLLLDGNPVLEAGGAVEIRELIKSE